jgi:hypothetical protein
MKWLIVGILTLTSLFTQANNLANTCEITGDETLILFSNGMNNRHTQEESDIDDSLEKLILSIEDITSENERKYIEYKPAINHKENRLLELMEVMTQRRISNEIDWNSVWSENGYAPLVPQEVFGVDEVDDPDWDDFQDQGIRPYIDDDFTKQKDLYLKALRAGKRIIVVAHSQGNMYANAIWKSIEAEDAELVKSITIINVASPDENAANQSKIVTAKEDAVINFVRKAFPSTTDGNFNFGSINTLDRANHSFLNAYMRDSVSLTLIKDFVREALDHTPYPQIEVTPSNLPEGRLGCDATVYATAGAQDIVAGSVILPADVDYLDIELQFDAGIVDAISSVQIISETDSLILDIGDLSFENQTITVNIDSIPVGSHQLLVTPMVERTKEDGTIEVVPLAVNQVSGSDVPQGYLPSGGSNYFVLTIERQGDLEQCAELEGIPLSWKVISSNLIYVNGVPVNMKGDKQVSIKVQSPDISEDLMYCIDASSTLNEWDFISKNSYGGLDLRNIDTELVTFEIYGTVPEHYYRNIFNFYLVLKNGYKRLLNFNDQSLQNGAPAVANFPLVYCDIVDYHLDSFDENWQSNRLCQGSGGEYIIYEFQSNVLKSISSYNKLTFSKIEEIFCDEEGRCSQKNRDEYSVVSITGLSVTYTVYKYRDGILISQENETYELGKH